nr:uncharacterized protein LOC111833716 isoform X1 [Paramormyrops kingsleyae]XP_023648042.1 uncharacterized protein LOC111833716 isoform X2 [Paramormyrops kingsleyae]
MKKWRPGCCPVRPCLKPPLFITCEVQIKNNQVKPGPVPRIYPPTFLWVLFIFCNIVSRLHHSRNFAEVFYWWHDQTDKCRRERNSRELIKGRRRGDHFCLFNEETEEGLQSQSSVNALKSMEAHRQKTRDFRHLDLEKAGIAGAWMTMTVVNFSSRRKNLFLLLVFFVSLPMNRPTSAETHGSPPKTCIVCKAECASQWKRVYKTGDDRPLWERQEHPPHCSSDLKLSSNDFICQYNNQFIVVTDQDDWTYIFEATGKHLNTVTEPCPEFHSEADSQKDSSQHNHSCDWTVRVLIVASILTLWWLLIQ